MGRFNTRKRDRQNSLCEKVSLNLASVAANTIATETFTDSALAAMKTNWVVMASWSGTPDAGLIILGARCDTNGVLKLVLFNPHASNAANPAAADVNVVAWEPDL